MVLAQDAESHVRRGEQSDGSDKSSRLFLFVSLLLKVICNEAMPLKCHCYVVTQTLQSFSPLPLAADKQTVITFCPAKKKSISIFLFCTEN